MANVRRLHGNRQRLQATFARVQDIPFDKMELRADFARYLCVTVSGYVETAMSAIARDHARRQASPTVFGYVDSQITRPGTINSDRLLQIVGSFNSEWRVKLDYFMDGKRKDALNSVVANRNSIAHGESVGLTYARIKEYFDHIEEVVDFVDELFSA